jgi:hypothetical protein
LSSKVFVVQLEDGSSYLLVLSSPAAKPPSVEPLALQTSLAIYQSLLILLSKSTSIPHPTPLHLSDSLDIIPYEYLILSCPSGTPLSELRQHGKLSEHQNALVDLQIGRWMREMHDNVQNDWFGLPKLPATAPPAAPSFLFGIPGLVGEADEEPSYSWQETFTSLLESMMHSAETLDVAPDVSYPDLRRSLGRAIGSFLFDDCEVPSLVSFLADEGSVFIDMPTSVTEDTEPRITSLLPPTHALYGDPLLETFFLFSGPSDLAAPGEPAPSKALLEGYGGNPIVFRRQKTKRTWYDVFLCLAVLLGAQAEGDGHVEEEKAARVQWAVERLKECVDILKDAPCY